MLFLDSLLVVATTIKNANVALIFQFLHRVVDVSHVHTMFMACTLALVFTDALAYLYTCVCVIGVL